MNRSVKLTLISTAVLLVFGGVCLVGLNSKNNSNNGSTNNQLSIYTSPTPSGTQDSDVALTLTYTGKGFEPNLNVVKVGSQIRVRNRSVRLLSFVSDPYPTQNDEPELNIGNLKPSESKTFFVTQKGTWGYHNALDPSQTGTLIVQ